MEPRIIEELHAVRQLPKLRSLLKRYRHAKIVQIGLLNLSELSSTVNDMVDFYPALRHIIYSLLNTENFSYCPR